MPFMTSGGKKTGERIAKYLARAGVASRREAERLIAARRIKVDGKTLDHPAFSVTGENRVTVDGKPVKPPERARLWRYHKPAGRIVAAHDPRGRPTVFAALPKTLPRVISVGRLDLNSEGLLLLTNDGALSRHLEKSDLPRCYRVRVQHDGALSAEKLKQLEKGATIEGIRYKPVKAGITRGTGGNLWLSITLREGRNREIRKLMAHLGARVNRLRRLSFGPFRLARLPLGAVEEIPQGLLRKLLPDYFAGKD